MNGRRLACASSVIFAMLLVAAPRAARAQDRAVEEARIHFNLAQAAYEKADFAKAAEEFMAAYAAKPFPAFLFNAAVCAEKTSEYPKAVELFKRYLAEEPTAADKADVEKRIADLEERIAKAAAGTPIEVDTLPKSKTKGLTVIETNPEGATIRLDDPGKPPLAKSNWSGQLPPGRHTVILDLRGYKSERKEVNPSQDVQFAYYFFRMSEDPELGYMVITSNVADAAVYLDGAPEVWARVADERNLKRGKHRIVVSREGYERKELEIDIKAGQLNTIPVNLDPAPIGFVRVRGLDTTQGAKVKLDGKEVCPAVPCRFEAPEGNHKVTVAKGGKKPFSTRIDVARMTEATMTVRLADQPSRFWPVATNFFWAGVIGTGGFLAGQYLNDDTAGVFDEKGDSGYENGFRYGFWIAGGAIAAIYVYHGIVEWTKEKGGKSTGSVESRNLTWAPAVGPGLAGAEATWRF